MIHFPSGSPPIPTLNDTAFGIGDGQAGTVTDTATATIVEGQVTITRSPGSASRGDNLSGAVAANVTASKVTGQSTAPITVELVFEGLSGESPTSLGTETVRLGAGQSVTFDTLDPIPNATTASDGEPVTLRVDANRDSDSASTNLSHSVQNAVDFAVADNQGTVDLLAGTFVEEVTIDTDNATIGGAGTGSTTIDGNVTLSGDNNTLEKFTIDGNLTITGADNDISNITVTGTTTNPQSVGTYQSPGGGNVFINADATLTDVTSDAIVVQNNSNADVSNSTLETETGSNTSISNSKVNAVEGGGDVSSGTDAVEVRDQNGNLNALFDTVQQGVNNTVADGQLVVTDGTYNENVVVASTLAASGDVSGLTITSADGASPEIVFEPSSSTGIPDNVTALGATDAGNLATVEIYEPDVTFEGIDVTRNAASDRTGDGFNTQGITVRDAGVTVQNTTVTSNLGNDPGNNNFGVFVSDEGNPTDNVALDNLTADGFKIGVLISDFYGSSIDGVDMTNIDATTSTDVGLNIAETSQGAGISGITGQDEFESIRTNQNVQTAVDLASAGADIEVRESTYDESVTVDKAVTVEGPNDGTPGDATRGPEAIVTNGLKITADNVTIDGLQVENTGRDGIRFGPDTVPSNVTIQNSVVTDVTGAVGGKSAGNGIQFQFNSVANETAQNIQILDNEISNITTPDATDKETIAIGVNVLPRGNNVSLEIRGNTFTDIEPGTSTNNRAEARGVSLSTQDDNLNGFGRVDGAVVTNNTFDNISAGDNVRAVALFEEDDLNPREGVKNFSVTQNNFTNLSGATVNTTGALFVGGYETLGADHVVTENNFDSGGVLRFANASQIGSGFNSSVAEDLDATENWWGNPSGPSGAGPGVGNPVSENVTFDPWLDAPFPAGQPVTDGDFAVQSFQSSATSVQRGDTVSANADVTNSLQVSSNRDAGQVPLEYVLINSSGGVEVIDSKTVEITPGTTETVSLSGTLSTASTVALDNETLTHRIRIATETSTAADASIGVSHSVSAALNAAGAGGTVTALAGTYDESISIPNNVTLLGPNAGTPADESRNNEATISGTVEIVGASGVTVDGFKIAEGSGQLTSGVSIQPGSSGADGITVTNSIIENMSAAGGGGPGDFTFGVLSFGGNLSDVTITDNRIANIGNPNVTQGVAVSLQSLTGTTAGTGATVERNTVRNISSLNGMRVGTGVALRSNFNGNDSAAVVAGNSFAGLGIAVSHPQGDTATVDRTDLATVVVDDPGSMNQQRIFTLTVQNAVTAAESNATVEVGPGTFEESVTIGVEGLTLEAAEGADATTINASSDPIDLFDGTVAVKIAADDVKVDGFTVEGAGASVSFTAVEGVEVRNNVLKNGLLGLNGGGDIKNNTLGGVALFGEIDAEVINNDINDGAEIRANQFGDETVMRVNFQGKDANVSIRNNTLNIKDNASATQFIAADSNVDTTFTINELNGIAKDNNFEIDGEEADIEFLEGIKTGRSGPGAPVANAIVPDEFTS